MVSENLLIAYFIFCAAASLTQDEVTTTDNEALTTDDEATATDDEATATDDEATATDDEATATDDEATATDDEATATDDEATATDDEASVTDNDATTTDDEASTTRQESTTTVIASDALFSEYGYPKSGDVPVLNRKIFRGARVSILEHPYVVSVRRKHAHYLTGALLTKNLVVSVAHPLHKVPTSELGAVVGESYSDRGRACLTVLLVAEHQDFDPYTLRADLALLRLYENVKFKCSQKVIPTYGPRQSLGQRDEEHKAYVTGWGRCDYMGNEFCLPRSSVYFPDERQDPMLRTISFKYISPERNHYCVGYERHETPPRAGMLCAGTAREEDALAPCMAVPGAPLVVQGSLVGLQSWGFGCGYMHDLPLLYTDLNYYDKWINHNINIMDKINMSEISSLYVATKAHIMKEWLLKTREGKTKLTDDGEHRLKLSHVDRVLVELEGNVTDFRDYIHDGRLRQAKLEMYESIRAQIAKLRALKLIRKQHKLRGGRPFIDRAQSDSDYELPVADANKTLDNNSSEGSSEQ